MNTPIMVERLVMRHVVWLWPQLGDRGFTMNDLRQPLGCTLNSPPLLNNQGQFTEDPVKETQRGPISPNVFRCMIQPFGLFCLCFGCGWLFQYCVIFISMFTLKQLLSAMYYTKLYAYIQYVYLVLQLRMTVEEIKNKITHYYFITSIGDEYLPEVYKLP